MKKIEALAKHLKIDPEDITESRYDDCMFEISATERKLGNGPKEAFEDVKVLKKALHRFKAYENSHQTWTFPGETRASLLSEAYYAYFNKLCIAEIGEDKYFPSAAEYQRVVNTLYHMQQKDTEGQGKDLQEYRNALVNFYEEAPLGSVEDWREYTEVNSGEYLVLTDDEADERCKASCESYIDDCLEIPEAIEPYFDREKWIKDAINSDGRGPLLAAYDMDEIEMEGYYIYRIN